MEVLFLLFALVGLVVYFLPALVAFKGRHPHKAAIAVVNVFFGWTLIGWVGCLAWSLIKPQTPARAADS